MRRVVRCVARFSLLFGAFALIAAACGGAATEEADGPNIIDAGSVSIQLPDDFDPDAGDEEADTVVDGAEGESAGATSDGADESPDTDADEDVEADDPVDEEEAIPLAEDDTPPIVGLIEAFEVFSNCLDGEGYEFVGAPGQDGATPDQFEPAYLAALQQCAAESNILQAVEASQAADASLSPSEIEDRNVAFLDFVDCLELRGWAIDEIVPSETGLLQAGNNNQGLTPPPGVNFFDSSDIRECIQQAADDNGFDVEG